MGAVLGWILGLIPLLGWLLWWWNEIWYAWPVERRGTNASVKLPPGQMGFPFFGEIFTFLWTHLFGSPSIMACFPSISKFIFRDEDAFLPEWPNVDLVGRNSVVAVHGKAHARLRSFVLNALTFEIIGKLFMSFEPGPQLDEVYWLLHEMCRKKVEAIFEVEPEKRKSQSEETVTDLMDGIRQIKDEEGKKLSDQEVLDNIIILVIAGYESTALASLWAIYYIPIQNKNGEFITSEDVSNMNYTNKVAEETLRLAYIGAFKFRLVARDINYKGYRIPKGRKVILWLQYLHTNPEIIVQGSAKPEAYQVFGGESRICAENMLARMQLAILLHHLSVGYKWELLNPDADFFYLPHRAPADKVEVSFSKL
ncbi:hypothetical protein EUGRSUZ_L03454 [Eucalyptus grandis]|uniref:Cytochrome P450 n=1 Tax=Eucalyptus grandis TaxID=71139 RepID=A0AAD9T8C9_EUCGR|nr:hypothetical protein EUGRSUZ_L03454 [Eucalyptus grandis]